MFNKFRLKLIIRGLLKNQLNVLAWYPERLKDLINFLEGTYPSGILGRRDFHGL